MKKQLTTIALLSISTFALAESVPNTFQSGDTISSQQMNENFGHVTSIAADNSMYIETNQQNLDTTRAQTTTNTESITELNEQLNDHLSEPVEDTQINYFQKTSVLIPSGQSINFACNSQYEDEVYTMVINEVDYNHSYSARVYMLLPINNEHFDMSVELRNQPIIANQYYNDKPAKVTLNQIRVMKHYPDYDRIDFSYVWNATVEIKMNDYSEETVVFKMTIPQKGTCDQLYKINQLLSSINVEDISL